MKSVKLMTWNKHALNEDYFTLEVIISLYYVGNDE